MRFFLTAALFANLAGACATAAKPESTAVAAAETGEKKICKSMPVMGSNFPKRVCSTKAEWEKFDRDTYKSVEDFDRDRRSGIAENDTANDLGRAD
jgi:hypothetical protein